MISLLSRAESQGSDRFSPSTFLLCLWSWTAHKHTHKHTPAAIFNPDWPTVSVWVRMCVWHRRAVTRSSLPSVGLWMLECWTLMSFRLKTITVVFIWQSQTSREPFNILSLVQKPLILQRARGYFSTALETLIWASTTGTGNKENHWRSSLKAANPFAAGWLYQCHHQYITNKTQIFQ